MKVEVDGPGLPSLNKPTVSVDVKQHFSNTSATAYFGCFVLCLKYNHKMGII